MNDAELQFWGTPETMWGYLRSVRPIGEEPEGYDDRVDFEFAVGLAEALGERGETLLAELMKMKRAAEAEHATEEATLELVAG